MKIAIAFLSVCCLSVSAFVVPSRGMAARPAMTLASDKPNDEDGEEGGLDLDLGEMFEMFDAADKEQSFDDAIKKVKKGN